MPWPKGKHRSFGLYVPDFTLTDSLLVEVKGYPESPLQLRKLSWCVENGYDVRVVDGMNITNIDLNISWRQRQSGVVNITSHEGGL
jgi:hypothetical protein